MSDTEKMDRQVGEDIENLQLEVQSVQTLLSVSLMLFLVFSICINIFLGIQVAIIRDQVHVSENGVNGFLNFTAPQLYQFYARLNDYSSRHPEFKPVLAKYGQFFAEHKYLTTPAPPVK